MTPLGKPLVFHLKYMAEMNLLYGRDEGDKPDLTGLSDAEQVLEMARTVGATAYEQAADFLELCGKEIETHFADQGIAVLAKKKKRSYVLDNWAWAANFDVPSVPGGSFACGAYISAPPEMSYKLPEGACGAVVTWLWSRGGRKGADAVWKILGGWPPSRGEGLVEASGDIALACILIKAQPLESFDADRDHLIEEVKKTFARIGPKETKAIADFVAGLNEPDES